VKHPGATIAAAFDPLVLSALAAAAPPPLAKPMPKLAPSGYHVAKALAVPGEGGWDYLFVDEGARRLYVSHSTKVDVLDADSGKIAGAIDGLSGVHGIAVDPSSGRGFITNGRTNTVTVFATSSLAKVAEVPSSGQAPDAIVYDPLSKRVLAMNHRSGDITVIDPGAAKVVARIDVGGELEFATSDGAGRVYVNVEDRSEVAAIDTRSMKVVARWPLAPCEEPTGMGIDRAGHRLVIGCGNRMAAVVNADTGKVTATFPAGESVDGAAFDEGTHLGFVSAGEGWLTVLREEAPDRWTQLANVETRRGARTMTVDTKTHDVFLSTAKLGPPPAPTTEQPHPRPSIEPGSFVVLLLQR
jgi:YVTN family beta-propeller protein